MCVELFQDSKDAAKICFDSWVQVTNNAQVCVCSSDIMMTICMLLIAWQQLIRKYVYN